MAFIQRVVAVKYVVVTHLAKNCPDKGRQGSVAANGPIGRSMRLKRGLGARLPNLLVGMILRKDHNVFL